MKGIKISWFIDEVEAFDRLFNMTEEQVCAELWISQEEYKNMSWDERFDYASDWYLHNWHLREFMGLPDEADIPDAVIEGAEDKDSARDMVAKWLSDKYGYECWPFLIEKNDLPWKECE